MSGREGFGHKLVHLRRARGLTQRMLGEQLRSAGQSHLSQLESGRKSPTVRVVIDLARFFRVRTDYLLDDDVPLEPVLPLPADIPPAPDTLAERLRTHRTAQQLSQTVLAQQVGLRSYMYISKMERGIKEPSAELVVKLAAALGVTTDYLLLGIP